MPRVSIYSSTAETRKAIASLMESEPDLEVDEAGPFPSSGIEDPRETDIVVVTKDLPADERLQIVGLVWRSNHPPRTLFLDCRHVGGESGPWVVHPADGHRCLSAIRGLIDGDSFSERISLPLYPAPAPEEDTVETPDSVPAVA